MKLKNFKKRIIDFYNWKIRGLYDISFRCLNSKERSFQSLSNLENIDVSLDNTNHLLIEILKELQNLNKKL